MSKKKTKYQEKIDSIMEKVYSSAKDGKKPAIMTSKSDLIEMATDLLNSPEHTVVTYDKKVKEADGTPLTIETQPSKRFRDSLKPMLRAMGIDKAELGRLDEYQFPKETGASMMEVAQTVIKDYTRAGRRLNFPITDMDESQMSLTQVKIPERVGLKTKFQRTPEGGMKVEPTGAMTRTKEHYAMHVTNRNLPWLKEDVEG